MSNPANPQTPNAPNPAPTTQAPQSPASAMQGGPADGMFPDIVVGAPQTPAQAPASASAPAPAPQPIIVGDMSFASFDAAKTWLDEQARLTRMAAQAATAQAPQTQTASAPTRNVRPGDLLWEDPNAAFDLVRQELKAELRAEDSAKAEEARIQREFYDKNEDLKGFEGFVRFKTTELLGRVPGFDKMPLDKAMEMVAAETRAELSKVRGSTNAGHILPSRPAMTAPVSGGAASQAQTPPPAQLTTFVDELQAHRAKRAK